MRMEKTVGIGAVVQQCNVSEKQLRYWQDAGYIEPEKVVCGDRTYRRYWERDVALITEIKTFLDEGFNLAIAVEKAKENLRGQQ